MSVLEDALSILESGSSEEKIKLLEVLDGAKDPDVIKRIIAMLDDDDIRVRGEAFSSLVLNGNGISDLLAGSMGSASKNIRGFASLVLANRNETAAIPEIMRLADDEHSMVRSCAIGALEYLGAAEARDVFLRSIFDPSIEVRNGALHALVKLGIPVPEKDIKRIDPDPETEELVLRLGGS